MEHVPGAWDAMLSLHGGVRIDPMRVHHESHIRGHVPQGLVLFHRTGQRQHQKSEPRPSNLRDHLDVHFTDSRVEDCAHEEIIHHVARARVFAVEFIGGGEAVEIPPDTGDICDNHGSEQALAEVICDERDPEDVEIVHCEQPHQTQVVTGVSIAVIIQPLPQRSSRKSLHGHARHEACENQLHDEKEEIRNPDSL